MRVILLAVVLGLIAGPVGRPDRQLVDGAELAGGTEPKELDGNLRSSVSAAFHGTCEGPEHPAKGTQGGSVEIPVFEPQDAKPISLVFDWVPENPGLDSLSFQLRPRGDGRPGLVDGFPHHEGPPGMQWILDPEEMTQLQALRQVAIVTNFDLECRHSGPMDLVARNQLVHVAVRASEN
ncbi:MAG TPA: hypothetical protein VI796_05760 [Candidatus Thermoplasmatota archaeon]|nr:hypothetical protein [Candidatus Thermoplasmatota archaeon]